MENLTYTQLISFFAVFLVLIGAYNAIMTAIKFHREEKKRQEAPTDELTTIVKQHEMMLKNDKGRMDEMDAAIRIILRSNVAMLSHEINGNSVDKLKESMDEINRYLIER